MENTRGKRFFPIALFASVMGLAGGALSFRLFESIYRYPPILSTIVLVLATIAFIINLYFFLYRYTNHKEDVIKDFSHPVKMNFFGAIAISLLLLATLYYDLSTAFSFILWLVGAVFQFWLTLAILSKLIWGSDFQLAQFNPAWFIPIVGNIVVPLAGVYHASTTINWIFYGIGITFSIIYFTIFLKRVYFLPTYPDKLRPTYFILLAPLGIGIVSYIKMTGTVDAFIYILYGFGFYLGVLFIYQWKRFLKIPFFISWWAYLFPSAAMTNATMQMYLATNDGFLEIVYHLQIIGLLILTAYLIFKTLKAASAGKLMVKEE